MVLRKGYNEAVVRLRCVGRASTRAGSRGVAAPLGHRTIFCFLVGATILPQFPAKCKTVFSGFYAAVPVSSGAAVFSILSIPSGYTPDGPCRLASPINQSFEPLKNLKSTRTQ